MAILEKEIRRMIDKIFSEIANGQTLISKTSDPEMGIKTYGYKIDNIPYINLVKDAIAPVLNAKLKALSGADQRKVLRLETTKLIKEVILKTSDIDNDSTASGATLNDVLDNILATYRIPTISSEASIVIPTSGVTSDIIAIIDPPGGGTLLTINGYLAAGRIAYVSNVSTSGENVLINGPYTRTLFPGQSVEISYNGVGGFIESSFHDEQVYSVTSFQEFVSACERVVPTGTLKKINILNEVAAGTDTTINPKGNIYVDGVGIGGDDNLIFLNSSSNNQFIYFVNDYVKSDRIGAKKSSTGTQTVKIYNMWSAGTSTNNSFFTDVDAGCEFLYQHMINQPNNLNVVPFDATHAFPWYLDEEVTHSRENQKAFGFMVIPQKLGMLIYNYEFRDNSTVLRTSVGVDGGRVTVHANCYPISSGEFVLFEDGIGSVQQLGGSEDEIQFREFTTVAGLAGDAVAIDTGTVHIIDKKGNEGKNGAPIPAVLSANWTYVFDGKTCIMTPIADGNNRSIYTCNNVYNDGSIWLSMVSTGVTCLYSALLGNAFQIRKSTAVVGSSGQAMTMTVVVPTT